MGRTLVLFAALVAARAAAGQQPDPVSIGIHAVQALAATAAANDGDPHFTPTPRARPDPKAHEVQPDGASVETIVTGLYAAVTHGPEYEPNWKRLRALFLPKAIVVPPKRPDAETFAVLDADAFEARVRAYIAGRRQRGEPLGFTEREIARRESRFGNVCQVFSTYETLRAPHDKEPFARGVHSIQLVYDGWRWWIAALAWDNERADNPIPTATPTPAAPHASAFEGRSP